MNVLRCSDGWWHGCCGHKIAGSGSSCRTAHWNNTIQSSRCKCLLLLLLVIGHSTFRAYKHAARNCWLLLVCHCIEILKIWTISVSIRWNVWWQHRTNGWDATVVVSTIVTAMGRSWSCIHVLAHFSAHCWKTCNWSCNSDGVAGKELLVLIAWRHYMRWMMLLKCCMLLLILQMHEFRSWGLIGIHQNANIVAIIIRIQFNCLRRCIR